MATASDLPNPLMPSDFPVLNTEIVALWRQLFFDPVLSGNDDIACATCHHPALGTGDAMSLSIGEGGLGLGCLREVVNGNAPKARIPRAAPALFNLGAREFSVMFHDGRVQLNREAMYGIAMPEGRTLERPVPTALAAQNILLILSHDEMEGHPGENPIADAIGAEIIHGPNGAWQQITDKVEAIDEYRMAFDWIIGKNQPLHITDIGNALSQFITYEFCATDSPFDQYLNGKDDAYADAGRGMISGIEDDKYRFRTPSLRNMTLSAPYEHNGAYSDLEAMVRHHLDRFEGPGIYDRRQAALHELGESAKD